MAHTPSTMPLGIIGRHATVTRDGHMVAAGVITRIDLTAAENRPPMAHLSMDRSLTFVTMTEGDGSLLEVDG